MVSDSESQTSSQSIAGDRVASCAGAEDAASASAVAGSVASFPDSVGTLTKKEPSEWNSEPEVGTDGVSNMRPKIIN